METVWYAVPEDEFYFIQPDEFGTAVFYFTNLSYQMRQDYPRGLKFSDRETDEFRAVLEKVFPGIRRLPSLDHTPVIFSEEGSLLHGEIVDAGPRMWLPMDRLGFSFWKDVVARGTEILACDTPAGTLLMGKARRLMEVIYGELSVDRDRDIFLGCWQEGARVHAAGVRKLRKKKPGFDDEVLLQSYASDHRIDSAQSRYRLARAYFGEPLPAMEWIFYSFGFARDPRRFVEVVAEDVDLTSSDLEKFLAGKNLSLGSVPKESYRTAQG